MKTYKPILLLLIAGCLLSLSRLPPFVTTPAKAQATQAANGPHAIIGKATSRSVAFLPALFPNPSVVLIDVTNLLKGEPARFVPESGQILGFLTQPLFPGPGQVRINLPLVPTGDSIDLKHDGKTHAGVQVYALQVASNLINDSYLQQSEQAQGLASYLQNIASGAITEGAFLVYAPDDQQSFPTASGADGLWFTADDPTAPLPAGYTVATLTAAGRVTLDRSPEATMNTIEREEAKSPDFSQQGILDSYHSLLDVLKARYAYTQLRKLDWDALRAQYLPAVEQANAKQDSAAYFLALDALAKALNDTHVSAVSYTPEAVVAQAKKYLDQVAGSVGASTIAVTDPSTGTIGDRIFVLTVGKNTPAAATGWVSGTEIVSINGEPPVVRLPTMPLINGLGTAEGRRVAQARLVLNFPMSQTVTVGYILPKTTQVLTATLMTGDYAVGDATPPVNNNTPVSYAEVGDYAVVRWSDFISQVTPKIAVLEEALSIEHSRSKRGVILDLRSNTGGWLALYQTMASYFFTAAAPMQVHVFDSFYYDQQSGKHLRAFVPDYQLSAPRSELAYTGPLVILVDEHCASACEYFSQHLQLLKRATVIGQYQTAGAGGSIERVKLPGNIIFQFTQGVTTFAGTDEPNLEAKGVAPDVRVPVTIESELAKQHGADPVMEAALAFLDKQADRLSGSTWQWRATLDASAKQTPIEHSGSYTLTFAADGALAIQADCNRVNGSYTRDEYSALTLTLGPSTLAACPPGSQSDAFLHYLGAVKNYTYDGDNLILIPDKSDVAGLVLTLVQ